LTKSIPNFQAIHSRPTQNRLVVRRTLNSAAREKVHYTGLLAMASTGWCGRQIDTRMDV